MGPASWVPAILPELLNLSNMATKKPSARDAYSAAQPYTFHELPALQRVQYLQAYRGKIETLNDAVTDLQIEHELRPPHLQKLLPADYLTRIAEKLEAVITEIYRTEGDALKEHTREANNQRREALDIEREREREQRRAGRAA